MVKLVVCGIFLRRSVATHAPISVNIILGFNYVEFIRNYKNISKSTPWNSENSFSVFTQWRIIYTEIIGNNHKQSSKRQKMKLNQSRVIEIYKFIDCLLGCQHQTDLWKNWNILLQQSGNLKTVESIISSQSDQKSQCMEMNKSDITKQMIQQYYNQFLFCFPLNQQTLTRNLMKVFIDINSAQLFYFFLFMRIQKQTVKQNDGKGEFCWHMHNDQLNHCQIHHCCQLLDDCYERLISVTIIDKQIQLRKSMGNGCTSKEDFRDIRIDITDIQCNQCKKQLTGKGKNQPAVYGCQNQTHLYCGDCYFSFFATTASCRCKICGRTMTAESKQNNQYKNMLIRCVDGFTTDKKIQSKVKVSLLLGYDMKEYAPIFESLKRLALVNSNLSKIECLSYFKNLIFLHISNARCTNKITNIIQIPNSTSLQFLRVEFNLISQIPHVKCDSLKTLVLRSNNIIAMSGLQNYPNLNALNLSSNQLTAVTGLRTCSQLTILVLNDNKITNLDGLQELPNLLSQLELQNNLVKNFDSYNCLATSLTLLLVGNPLTAQSLQILNECAFLQHLTKFSISINDTMLTTLEMMIDTELTSLKQLLLNRDKDHIPTSLKLILQKRVRANKSFEVVYQKWKMIQN